jgi:hypothetical protein
MMWPPSIVPEVGEGGLGVWGLGFGLGVGGSGFGVGM